MDTWLQALTRLEREGEPSVLITVVAARGSTPREAGCKMVVTAASRFDTIGGGNLEFTCVETAREMLGRTQNEAGRPMLRDFPLGPALGQCCGGHVSVLFEPLRPAITHVAVFGAGHVGRELVSLLARLPMRVTWIDTRPDALIDVPGDVVARLARDPAAEVAALPSGTIVMVITHDHQIDFDIVAAALPRTDLAAVGLIGSATKRARFLSRLRRLGVACDRLICPIGVPGTGGKLPIEIAISVAAQILGIQRQLSGIDPMGNATMGDETSADRTHDAIAECGDCTGECAPRAVKV